MTDLTIIYYTDNSLDRGFAAAVTQRLAATAAALHIRIVCVSQMLVDVDFVADKICVGEIGRSWRSIYTQIIAGCEESSTRYVALCEHDVFYSFGHFHLRPPEDVDGIYDQNCHRLLLKERVICLYRGGRSMSLLVGRREAVIDNLRDKLSLFKSENDFRGYFEPGKGEAELGLHSFSAQPAAAGGEPSVQICNHGKNFSKKQKRSGDWHTDRLQDGRTIDDLIAEWHLPVGD